jgi:hypothetical protein
MSNQVDFTHIIPQVTVLQYNGHFEMKMRLNMEPMFEAEFTTHDGRKVLFRSYVFCKEFEHYFK